MAQRTIRCKVLICCSVLMLLSTLSCNVVQNLLSTPTPTSTPTLTPIPTFTPTPTPTNTPTPTPTPTPRPTPVGGAEWIVFTRLDGEDDTNIYAIRVDGSEVKQLTNDPANDYSPAVSPDGRSVVFVSDRDGNKNLYRVNIDGTGLTRLTFTVDDEYDPDWSPDGQRIAFVSLRSGSKKTEIWTARIDDTGLDIHSLTPVTYDEFNDYDPNWSPDGRTIAYSSFRAPGKGYTIFMVNADGTQARQVTTDKGWDRSPRWSPDGKSLVFVRWDIAGITESREFWILETRDQQLRVLYTDKFEIQELQSDIYAINVDGTETRRLTEGGDAWAPRWSPDGQWIAFVSDRDGDSDIYRMRPDGAAVTSVTENTTEDCMPSWGGTVQRSTAQWRTIISDPFDDNRNDWLIELGLEDEYWFSLNQQVTEGVYRWEGKAKQGVVRWAHPDIRSLGDFRLSVAFRRVSGASDADAGVVFRLSRNYDNYYMFKVNPGFQEYTLDLWHNDGWTTLIDWTYTSAIFPEGWNRIEVEAIGSAFTFWINGQRVADTTDSTLRRGMVGLMIGVYDPGDEAVFEFDDFQVSAP